MYAIRRSTSYCVSGRGVVYVVPARVRTIRQRHERIRARPSADEDVVVGGSVVTRPAMLDLGGLSDGQRAEEKKTSEYFHSYGVRYHVTIVFLGGATHVIVTPSIPNVNPTPAGARKLESEFTISDAAGFGALGSTNTVFTPSIVPVGIIASLKVGI